MTETFWRNCYSGTRKDLFTPESNRHPAKMAVGLCYRIFEHGRERGYWKPGDLILDPMAGIFTTGIVGASLGYKVVGVELEKHFIDLALRNIEFSTAQLGSGVPIPLIVQGDARRLSEILNLKCAAAISSPPYADCPGTPSLGSINKDAWGKEGKDIVGRRGLGRGYSGAITSPPYVEAQTGGGIAIKGHFQDPDLANRQYTPDAHGRNASQIGNLKDPLGDIDAVLSSSLYERCEHEHGGHRGVHTKGENASLLRRKADYFRAESMGDGETYLAAMLAVYHDLHAVLKLGGVVCLVTKNPVKKGKIRRLDEDTIRLMEAAGFTLIERVKAMLAEDLAEQSDMFGEPLKIRREHKSFFKHLFEAKHPDLRVDHEDVMFFRRVIRD